VPLRSVLKFKEAESYDSKENFPDFRDNFLGRVVQHDDDDIISAPPPRVLWENLYSDLEDVLAELVLDFGGATEYLH
jgi:hypothetical protein